MRHVSSNGFLHCNRRFRSRRSRRDKCRHSGSSCLVAGIGIRRGSRTCRQAIRRGTGTQCRRHRKLVCCPEGRNLHRSAPRRFLAKLGRRTEQIAWLARWRASRQVCCLSERGALRPREPSIFGNVILARAHSDGNRIMVALVMPDGMTRAPFWRARTGQGSRRVPIHRGWHSKSAGPLADADRKLRKMARVRRERCEGNDCTFHSAHYADPDAETVRSRPARMRTKSLWMWQVMLVGRPEPSRATIRTISD